MGLSIAELTLVTHVSRDQHASPVRLAFVKFAFIATRRPDLGAITDLLPLPPFALVGLERQIVSEPLRGAVSVREAVGAGTRPPNRFVAQGMRIP